MVVAAFYNLTNSAEGFCFSISSLTLVIFFLFFNISHLSRYEVMFQCDFFSFLNFFAAAAAKSLQSCPTLCDPIDGSPPGSPVSGILQARTLGVGCHFLLQCMKVKSEKEVAQSCPTLSDPMDCSLPAPLSMGPSRQEYWSGLLLCAQ